jgi:16S rRNA (cytosine1402-N4)-methyltransferase
MQIDQPERGFSYAVDAPLDMRMDPRGGDTAADLLANLSERELADMFSRYGEERYSRQIARAICRRRMSQPYERSADLVDTIRHAIPTPAQFGSGHPAKRVFQALRIAVNDELAMVEDGLDAAMQILKPGGRIAVISFHSLEDRIVKERFRDASAPCTCPPDLPICGCNREATLRVLTPRVIRPGSSELDRNPRAASSRLRVAERTTAALPKDAA